MNKVLKFLLVIVFIVITLNLFTIRTEAATRYVYDNADILTVSEDDGLTNLARHNSQQYDVDFCFLTIDMCFMDPYEYAKNFYYTHGFENNGIIFMIFEDEMYIETFGSFKNVLTADQIQRIESIGNTEILRERYEESFISSTNEFNRLHAPDNDKNDLGSKNSKNVSFLVPTFLSLCISCVVTAAIACFFVFYHNAANKKLNAVAYLSHDKESFKVTDRTTIFVGNRQEICRGYYRERSKR